MVSVSPASSAALFILQQIRDSNPANQQSVETTDIVKSNGVSAEFSRGMKSVASAAGKFAVDNAPPAGKTVTGDLGTFKSWEEAFAYVENDETISAQQKSEWLAKLTEAQKAGASAEELRGSELYRSIMSGAIRAELEALRANSKGLGLTRKAIDAIHELMAETGATH